MRFYSHLIEIDTINAELDTLELSDREKQHLAMLFDSTLHHTILDAVLSQMSAQDKELFMQHLQSGDEQKIWDFLNARIDKIEDKIKTAAKDLKVKMHEDIKEARLKQR